MLINLSNHPLGQWDEVQLAAARQYGEIVEMPFPDIDPHCTEDDVLSKVEEYLERIECIATMDTVVHVMGEMTFTYNMVSALKKRGIKCIASTTHRDTEIMPDGSKLSKFIFVKFREY